jgi:hypothetical protein
MQSALSPTPENLLIKTAWHMLDVSIKPKPAICSIDRWYLPILVTPEEASRSLIPLVPVYQSWRFRHSLFGAAYFARSDCFVAAWLYCRVALTIGFARWAIANIMDAWGLKEIPPGQYW